MPSSVVAEQSSSPASTPSTRASASTTPRRSRWPAGSRRWCAIRAGEREEVVSTPSRTVARRRGRPAGVARRGLRRHAGAHGPLLHPGARRRHHRLRHPGPGRVGAPHRLRERVVARRGPGGADHRRRLGHRRGGHFVALVEIKALDRPRLLQDVTATLSDNHVNILTQPEPLRARPGVEDALRVRARRPVAPGHAAQPPAHHRQRLRRLSGGAGRRPG